MKKSGIADILFVELIGELYKSGVLRGQTTPTAHQLAYLAQVVRQAGFSADYMQARPLFDIPEAYRDPSHPFIPQPLQESAIIQMIEEKEPSIVAFGMAYYQIPDTIHLARELKKRNPKLTVIGGGYGATGYPELLLDNPGVIDYLVLGNAFETLPRLVEHFMKDSSKDAKLGRKATTLEHRLFASGETEFMESSELIGRSAYATLDNDGRLLLLEKIAQDDMFDATGLEPVPQKEEYAGVSSYIFPITIPSQRSYNVTSSFGCGFNCTYCSSPQMFGTGKQGKFKTRFRDPDKVAKEIELLSMQNRANTIFFTDPNFNFDGNHLHSLLTRIISQKEQGIIPDEMRFYAMLTPYNSHQRQIHGFPLTLEEARDFHSKGIWKEPGMSAFMLMKKAGFGRVAFGAEAFTEENLMQYRRLNTLQDIKEYNEQAKSSGICTRNFYMLSNEDSLESLAHGDELIAGSLPLEIRIAYYVPTFESYNGRRFFARNLNKKLDSGYTVDPAGIYDIFKASDAGHNIGGISTPISNAELEEVRLGMARRYYSSSEYELSVERFLRANPEYERSVQYFFAHLKSQRLMKER
jgi:radical SAM superfamily enzyme YgiQ (UPF0313 family)